MPLYFGIYLQSSIFFIDFFLFYLVRFLFTSHCIVSIFIYFFQRSSEFSLLLHFVRRWNYTLIYYNIFYVWFVYVMYLYTFFQFLHFKKIITKLLFHMCVFVFWMSIYSQSISSSSSSPISLETILEVFAAASILARSCISCNSSSSRVKGTVEWLRDWFCYFFQND